MEKRLLSEIWIYPIKSLSGIRITSAKVYEKGLEHDRRWMLIDENGTFMTQRVHHQLALFEVSFGNHCFKINFKNDSVLLPFSEPLPNESIEAIIWEDTVSTHEVSQSLSNWFSERINTRCKLVAFPESNKRPVEAAYQINNEQVSLSDGYPFLIIGQESLNDLNHRLKNPVPINRFRPNFVFTGGEAYEEDDWQNFSIGKNRFAGVKPCARCVLTTINHLTGEKGVEPLATLATYRKKNNKIYFGQNVLAIDHYEINEGDEITF